MSFSVCHLFVCHYSRLEKKIAFIKSEKFGNPKKTVVCFIHSLMHPKDADRMANSEDPHQTARIWSGSTLFVQACLSEYFKIVSVHFLSFVVKVALL